MEASGKFQEKMMKKQKQAEKMLLENRLRHLNNQDERLQRQIQIANKNSNFADSVSQRKADDDDLKARCAEAEAARIARQNANNARRRN